MWNRFDKICIGLSKISVYTAMLLVFSIMALTVIDVLLRRLTPFPLLGVYEITEVTLASFVFLSLAYTWSVDGHIRVDILIKRVPVKIKVFFNIISNLAGIVVFFLLAWEGFWDALYILKIGLVTDILRIPLVFPKMLLSIGCFIFSLLIFVSLGNSILKLFSKKY
jgi:TRAP-type C4-dicarboxylate transport system permease small subunit